MGNIFFVKMVGLHRLDATVLCGFWISFHVEMWLVIVGANCLQVHIGCLCRQTRTHRCLVHYAQSTHSKCFLSSVSAIVICWCGATKVDLPSIPRSFRKTHEWKLNNAGILRLIHLYFSYFYFVIKNTYYNGVQKRKQVSFVCITFQFGPLLQKQAELCLFVFLCFYWFHVCSFFSWIVKNKILKDDQDIWWFFCFFFLLFLWGII